MLWRKNTIISGLAMPEFSLELLQAINDWQSGGDHNQKVQRGEALKEQHSVAALASTTDRSVSSAA